MSNAISSLFGNVKHWLTQATGPLLGELEEHLNIDDLLPPPKWYLRDVDPGKLARSSEPQGPTWNHWAEIKARHIGGVVSLQVEEPDELKEARPFGISTRFIPVTDNTAPSLAQIKDFLEFVREMQRLPPGKDRTVLVHCRAGKGRTGVMVACYRIYFQHWSADAAVAEAKAMGMVMDTQEQCIRDFARVVRDGTFELE
jgi:protein tyrosine phosphatase (PTP) superfamily phosphohydrolase (DUF442 family)